jgi:hypothetical protein
LKKKAIFGSKLAYAERLASTTSQKFQISDVDGCDIEELKFFIGLLTDDPG